jgi:hypothetical protein
LIGRSVDQAVLFRPKGREGPRLAELQVQTSSYGSQIPQIFGAMRVAGTVIWATDLRESKTKSGGGKGQPSVTRYSYSVSFAVALSARAAGAVGRIWADGNLLRGAAGDFKTAVGAFRFHQGGQDQMVDPLIAAAQGIAVTPAHRGIAYAVFEDLALADYGNRIPSLTFEILADAGPVAVGAIVRTLSGGAVISDAGAQVDGYAASGPDTRAALAPLIAGHGWVLRTLADKLGVDGGVAAGDAVSADMRAARLNGRAVVPLHRSRAPADSVPVRLALRHYDPGRDYQAGVQKAVRPGPGRREASADLPAAIAAGRAKALARDQLNAQWAARRGLDLMCGWGALVHAPGTILSVEGAPGLWRVAESEWEAMGVRLTLHGLSGEGPAAVVASGGGAVHQPDLPHGPTSLMLADLPVLGDTPPTAPVVVVAAAGESSGWRRAALFTVEPGSGTAVAAGGTAAVATMGTVSGAPGDGPAMIFDDVQTIEVELLADAMLLSGADDAALLRGANLCLAGRELIQFGTATQTGPRSFRLGRLLRGRRGTEWATGLHTSGEPFLLIEEDRLAPVPADAVHIGDVLSMLAIGIGDAVPAEAATAVSGEALIPLAPVHVRQESDGGGGRTIRWTRRSRAGWRWSDSVDAPLGEEQELYVLRLRQGDSVVRSAEASGPAWTYSATMIAADAAAGHAGPFVLDIRQTGTRAAGRAAVVELAA